ncbi:uncharacterized protein LOC111703141 [Eurytemora carolleeae]|uniref:uncharacterized protein LOC111703141 n=1 Tax=Eurytemora carolleeae TaxID=1294199 RepID=UPI000C76D2EC|nr:uncharacterized protein LOC111703141 [Eurytemora carolleeae]|eukprot:XP_023330784.1 uncharacterized protein LOC111703141 [Eurytemora affinis]
MTRIKLLLFFSLCLSPVLCQLPSNSYTSWYDKDQYNCTIVRIIQGEWFSREENEDVITHIDARQMSNRGICKEYENDFGAEYKFLFSQEPTNLLSCHYCVHISVRTVNILEKR